MIYELRVTKLYLMGQQFFSLLEVYTFIKAHDACSNIIIMTLFMLEKLEKQHELDIEKERELFKMEKEKMELEHKHQLELSQKDMENQLGANLTNTLITEAMKMPEVRRQFTQGIKNNGKKHK